MPIVLPFSEVAVSEAARVLRAGGLVAFPTETVYGLGAATLNPDALARIYEVKGRPSDNPLIAHVVDATQARTLVREWGDAAERLAQRWWPGPLTLVLERAEHVPAMAAGGRSTLAVRAPAHHAAQALLRAFGGAISAPSANRSGHVSPTEASHVAEEFAHVQDLLILDDGRCPVGLESTVVDLTREPARLLRPGAVTAAELREALGALDEPVITGQAASPGTALVHYAPRARAVLVVIDELPGLLSRSAGRVTVLAISPCAVEPPHSIIRMPASPEAYARELYAALRAADAEHPALIAIERPSADSGLWAAIDDRLRRATAPR